MGRRTGSGRAGGRSVPRRAAPPPARSAPRRAAPPARSGAAAKPPAASRQGQAPPPAKAAPAAAPPAPQQQGSAMGGFMANVASTGLGVMAGRALDRTIFGGSSAAAPAEGQGELPPQAYGDSYEYEQALPQIDDGVCAREIQEFKKCLERTGTDMNACNWNLEILQSCQQRAQDNSGFAEAGRF